MVRFAGMLALPLAFCMVGTPAMAEHAEGDWHFQLTPYVWLAGLDGDIATLPGLPKASVDASIDDVLDHTDLALMLTAEARYRRLGVFVDLAYLEQSIDEDTRGPFFSKVDLSTDTFLATFAGFYRVIDEDRGGLDLVAGARVWNIDTVLEFKPGLLAERRTSDEETWVDPVVGARASLQLFGPIFATAGGDIGGFGAASDFTWQVIGTLDLVPWDWFGIRVGYRHLDVDYDHGGFVWDVAMSGPIIGLSLRF